MTDKEKKVVAALTENARTSSDKLAHMTGIPEGEIKDMIKSLEKKGVIVKYTTILNPDLLDEDKVEALIEVKVTPLKGSGYDAIAEEISQFPEVTNVYLMSGAYDLAVIVEGKSLRSISRFVSERIATYDEVLSTATHFILKKYKVEGALTSKPNVLHRLSVQP